MKKLISAALLTVLVIGLFACSNETDGQSMASTDESSALSALGQPIQVSFSGTINKKTVQLLVENVSYEFKGAIIEKDFIFSDINGQFAQLLSNHYSCPASPLRLNLDFSEDTPISADWYGYYFDSNGTIEYVTPKNRKSSAQSEKHPILIKETHVMLELGSDWSVALDSEANSISYRGVFVVCEWDDGIIGYPILFGKVST
jgi:hypothetical protein